MNSEKYCDLDEKLYTFYDPLYEIRIYNALFSGSVKSRLSGDIDQIINRILCSIIDSQEFNRLNFIKQTGLAWLVFPSATHTLFSHSLGNLVIGEHALRNITIKKKTGRLTGNLDDWLTSLKLKDEFFLALLLNDIGKLPFFHVMQKNKYFSNYDSKKVAVQLIRGEGDAHNYYKERQDKTLNDILKEADDIDIDVLCYLINHETTKDFDNPSDIETIYEIINGKLDLDRLDHYRRDSYFIGTKFATFNIRSLLRNIFIDYDGHDLFLSNEGIKYAHQLLTNKEMLLCEAFENQVNLSYDAMLDFCIAKYFESLDDTEKKEFPFSTDEKILWDMMKESSISELVNRIVNRKPYIAKPMQLSPDLDLNKLKIFKEEFIKKFNFKEEDVLLYPSIPSRSYQNDWLNFNCENDDNKKLFELEGYQELISYISRKRKERENKIYFFISNPQIFDLFENEMKNIIR